MRSIELFGGAGGLALGAELAGFRPEAFVEWDRWACSTVRENKASGHPLVRNWSVIEGDVRSVDWKQFDDGIDLLTGGPPCQPFSMGGKAQAAKDKRDMFPAAIEALRTLRPRAFILENVKGLTRSTFANYYQLILLRLQFPEVVAKEDESWFDHLKRLQAVASSSGDKGLTYRVLPTVVDAADYGIPQRRHRVFIVGFRSDIDAEWAFPTPTHSRDALYYAQWISGTYWDQHEVSLRKRPTEPRLSDKKLRQLAETPFELLGVPWLTVRDALHDLPSPTIRGSRKYLNHILQPGAKIYPGHTGSPVDLPSKALKAGAHGVPGGENMLRRVDGSVRYFTVRESARLQTFPDDYELHGSWTEAMRQIGNAVPVLLAKLVAESVADHLALDSLRQSSPFNIHADQLEVGSNAYPI